MNDDKVIVGDGLLDEVIIVIDKCHSCNKYHDECDCKCLDCSRYPNCVCGE